LAVLVLLLVLVEVVELEVKLEVADAGRLESAGSVV
jgi:hypothetical protein